MDTDVKNINVQIVSWHNQKILNLTSLISLH
jgi:hypothetical protein